jgi:hypothetical protein
MVGMILRTFVDAGFVRRYGKNGFILIQAPPDPLAADDQPVTDQIIPSSDGRAT